MEQTDGCQWRGRREDWMKEREGIGQRTRMHNSSILETVWLVARGVAGRGGVNKVGG